MSDLAGAVFGHQRQVANYVAPGKSVSPEKRAALDAEAQAFFEQNGPGSVMPRAMATRISMERMGLEYQTPEEYTRMINEQIGKQRAKELDFIVKRGDEIVGARLSDGGVFSQGSFRFSEQDVNLTAEQLIDRIKSRDSSLEILSFQAGEKPNWGQLNDYLWTQSGGRTHHGGPALPLFDGSGHVIPAAEVAPISGARPVSLLNGDLARILANDET